MRVCALQQTLHRAKRPSEIGFEKSIEIVRKSQVRIESEGLLKCVIGAGEIVGLVYTILRQEAVDSPQTRPRRRIRSVVVHAAPVKIPRQGHALQVAGGGELIGTEIAFVGDRAGRNIGFERTALPGGQRKGQRLNNSLDQIVRELEE